MKKFFLLPFLFLSLPLFAQNPTYDEQPVYETNPGAQRNLYNRARRLEQKTQPSEKTEGLSDEQRREIAKDLFEGRGAQSNAIVTVESSTAAKTENSAPFLQAGYYDRLSRKNIGGYSPELAALQSALNAENVPGAPKLVATGRLDYATLSYPQYAMRHDLAALESRLESGASTPDGRRRVQSILEHAALAESAFEKAALEAKNQARINSSLLAELGSKQRQASRLITAAFLEEDLDGLNVGKNMLSPALMQDVRRCPVLEPAKADYLKRADDYAARIEKLKSCDQSALSLIEGKDWESKLGPADKLMADCSRQRKALQQDISNYTRLPGLLAETLRPNKPRWRLYFDYFLLRFWPSLPYSQKLLSEEKNKDALRSAFLSIASGR